MHKGYLCLVLHGHLPFVRHPEHEYFLEENWLFEAITETYIPLVLMIERLYQEKINFKLTLSLTPSLICMLKDDLLKERFLRHINKLIELSHKEIERTRWQPEFNNLAQMYLNRFITARDTFQRYRRDLTLAFKLFQEQGSLEIIASCATHAYLPLMDVVPASARAQIKVGVKVYQEAFGRGPKGFWLPECGYHPGHEVILKDCGVSYFFTELHAILHASPRPKYGIYAPVYCKSQIACFGRDWEPAKQVWSSIEGYPGDYWYREFYRDIGYDLDYEYIKPYIHNDGIRINTGIKYYRITGEDNKQVYDPHMAREKAAQHAGNFMFNRERQIEHLFSYLKKKPIIVAPYDAELFGHWWFEGPDWLEFLMRKINFDQKTIALVTASEYLNENPRNQVVKPSLSSWGWKGYNEMWLQGVNDWIYRHLHEASNKMVELVKLYPDENQGLLRRALNQALRELLIAQSSDWAFIMATATHTAYALRRTKEHLLRFTRLYEQIKSGAIDEAWLSDIEYKDNIFASLDYRLHQ